MEKWDLYTVDRKKTSQTMIRGDKIPDGLYRLAIHVCIFNSEGKMLIQKRQSSKDTWPNKWDVTVAGSAISGETSIMAAEREVYEELGLKICLANKSPSLTINFNEGFIDVYLLNMDLDLDTLKLQDEEVKAVSWANIDEIKTMIKEKKFIPYYNSLIDLLFDMRNQFGSIKK